MGNTTKKLYEGMFVLPQTFVREDQQRATDLLQSSFDKFEASVRYIGVWAEKPLAYEIDHVREATYFLVYFEAEVEAIAKLERHFHITDNILRILIVKPEVGFNLDEFLSDDAKKKAALLDESEESDIIVDTEEVSA